GPCRCCVECLKCGGVIEIGEMAFRLHCRSVKEAAGHDAASSAQHGRRLSATDRLRAPVADGNAERTLPPTTRSGAPATGKPPLLLRTAGRGAGHWTASPDAVRSTVA